jgi:hypothetical protein
MIEERPCCAKQRVTGVDRTEERSVQFGLWHPGERPRRPGLHREFDPWLSRC